MYYAVDMRPTAHTRMIERTAMGQTVHDFDTTKTTVALGWLDGHDFLAWVRDTGAVSAIADRARGPHRHHLAVGAGQRDARPGTS